MTPWTVPHQAPLSRGFSRLQYWSGLPFPSPGGLPDPGIKPVSPTLTGKYFSAEPLGKLEFKFITKFSYDSRASQWLSGEESACSAEDLGSIPGEGNGNPLCVLAWRIPWTEEVDRLQSLELQSVRHNWATNTLRWFLTQTIPSLLSCAVLCCQGAHYLENYQPPSLHSFFFFYIRASFCTSWQCFSVAAHTLRQNKINFDSFIMSTELKCSGRFL